MRTDIIRSNCPVVDHERGRFARIIDVSGGRGIYDVIGFDSDVAWLRDTEYTLALYNPEGRVLKEGGSYGDYRSYLSAYEDPFNLAARFAEEYGVTQGGTNAVELRMKVVEQPVYEVENTEIFHRTKTYRAIPTGWIRESDPGVPLWRAACARGEIFTEFDRIEKRTVSEDVIWSSRRGMSTSAQVDALKAAIERAIVGVSDDVAEAARNRLSRFLASKLVA